MKFISHRGNLFGPKPKMENKPDYVRNALRLNFDVEIDVFFKDKKFYLGHDKPLYEVKKKFLENKKIWCHAKTLETLSELKRINCHYFWHQQDDVTLTSKGYLWTYPGKKLFSKSICVLPEIKPYKKYNCYGVCSDYIIRYKKKLKND
tara:strand:- start:133 stop:576 length:444 start_codon:yes stop_codon:yes gene_type:complete